MKCPYLNTQILYCNKLLFDATKPLNIPDGEYKTKANPSLKFVFKNGFAFTYLKETNFTWTENKIEIFTNFNFFASELYVLYATWGYKKEQTTQEYINPIAALIGTVAVEVPFDYGSPIYMHQLPDAQEAARSQIRRTWREWPYGLKLVPRHDHLKNKLSMIWERI